MKLTQIMPNLHEYNGGGVQVFFSYETPIAYWDGLEGEIVVSENVWTRTTGRHLARIKTLYPNHVVLPHEEFTVRLNLHG
jgi:hypothetical protein